MKFFISQCAKLAVCFLFSSALYASCPLTCPTLIGPKFCSLNVTGPLNAASLCVAGNEQVGGSLLVCGPETIASTLPSTSCTNGALVVAGGVGIGGNLNVCGTETISNTGTSTSCTNGALVVAGGVGIGGNLNVCGLISASGFTGLLTGSAASSVIPYGGTIAAGLGFGILGADLGFGTSQGLTVSGLDTLYFVASRNGVLSNLILNVSSFVGVGTVTAEVYVSTTGGTSWTATGITTSFTASGTYSDLVDTFPVSQTNLIALRLTPSVAGLAISLGAGLEYQ